MLPLALQPPKAECRPRVDDRDGDAVNVEQLESDDALPARNIEHAAARAEDLLAKRAQEEVTEGSSARSILWPSLSTCGT